MSADLAGLSINLATVREQWGFAEAVDGCLRHGITAISPWRDQVAAIGLAEAARIVRANGLQRHRPLPRRHVSRRRRRRPRRRRSTTTAAPSTRRPTLGADCLVLVVGGLPAGVARTSPARAAWSRDGIAALLPHARAAGVPLAIEPLHPMYAADRACVNTLDQALDLCEALGDGVGVAIDVYHVWWDPDLARADRPRRPRWAHPRAPHLRLAGADHATCCSTAA